MCDVISPLGGEIMIHDIHKYNGFDFDIIVFNDSDSCEIMLSFHKKPN